MKRFLPPRIMIALTVALLMAFSLSAKAFEPFRFAVVTDVHINKTHPNPLQDLRLSVQQINATDRWRTCVLGFPFESLRSEKIRDNMMKRVLTYLMEK